jgi:hypothetical protein
MPSLVVGSLPEFNGCPTKEQLENYAWETINAGRVIPG